MGGERASTTRMRREGKICCLCGVLLNPDPQHLHGEKLCPKCLQARRPKHKVRMYYNTIQSTLNVCFLEGQTLLGKHHTYPHTEKLFAILKAANASHADHHNASESLRQGRPGSVELHLSEEQYRKLRLGGK
jgi:hypothetical protein